MPRTPTKLGATVANWVWTIYLCSDYITGVLTSMLGFQVSLMMIEKWFPKPASQKMVIHQELARMLSNTGVSWPPNAASFEQCPSYRTIQRPGQLGMHQLKAPLL